MNVKKRKTLLVNLINIIVEKVDSRLERFKFYDRNNLQKLM